MKRLLPFTLIAFLLPLAPSMAQQVSYTNNLTDQFIEFAQSKDYIPSHLNKAEALNYAERHESDLGQAKAEFAKKYISDEVRRILQAKSVNKQETEKPKEKAYSDELRARERAINSFLFYANDAQNTDGSVGAITKVLFHASETMSWERQEFNRTKNIQPILDARPERYSRISNRMNEIFGSAFEADRFIILKSYRSAQNIAEGVVVREFQYRDDLTAEQREYMDSNPYIICIVTHAWVQMVQISRKTNQSAEWKRGVMQLLDQYAVRVGGAKLRTAARAILRKSKSVIHSTSRCITPRQAFKKYGFEFPPQVSG